ncbi:aminoglycoside phosphotransferase family protein [Pseudactinotalea terrae]|uniref:phosphotransferase n=1 Tax=Pseudactinotalea terrae TaxID=1743262 RepID=UPI0019D66F75|nr:aminoglycoside phosphotransferase family protein [Pseudactinotalea terrae]
MSDRRVEVDGDLVRRPAYPWTPTVHALLRHLRGKGLEVPEPLSCELGASGEGGVAGVEVVRLVEGVAGKDAWGLQATDRGLRSAATLLRRIHDAARSFNPPPGAVWAFPAIAGESLTVLHGDPGPWNMAWRDGLAVGLFDWDLARPGPALDDVAYALDYLLPLRTDEDCLRWHGFTQVPDRGARLRVFLDGYGPGADLDLAEVAAAILTRKHRTREEVADLAARGIEPQRTWVADGFLAEADDHLAWAESNIERLLR